MQSRHGRCFAAVAGTLFRSGARWRVAMDILIIDDDASLRRTLRLGLTAMGHTVAISGTIDIAPDKTCPSGGAAWPCGQRARAAFNTWLRGRALKCVLPPDVDRFAIAAPCMLGRQDVGAWLVSNGWALASPSGIYGKAETTARVAKMGIFGPPQ